MYGKAWADRQRQWLLPSVLVLFGRRGPLARLLLLCLYVLTVSGADEHPRLVLCTFLYSGLMVIEMVELEFRVCYSPENFLLRHRFLRILVYHWLAILIIVIHSAGGGLQRQFNLNDRDIPSRLSRAASVPVLRFLCTGNVCAVLLRSLRGLLAGYTLGHDTRH